MAPPGGVDNPETVRGVLCAKSAVSVSIQKPAVDPEPEDALAERSKDRSCYQECELRERRVIGNTNLHPSPRVRF